MITTFRYSLIVFILGLSRVASGEILIDGSQAAAEARRDPGTGACGHFVQYQRQGTPPMPPRNLQEAAALFDKPGGDPAVLRRLLTRTKVVNYRNGQGGAADFTGAMSPDEYLPFSQSPQAAPQGSDVDLAARIRGYFNVSSELVGKPLSFALNCDSLCSLRIGRMNAIPAIETTLSRRRIQQVRFMKAGLYPIELVYYQTGAAAYLEWAMSAAAETECESCTTPLTDAAAYGGRFTLVPLTRLYNAILGESPSCQECGGPGQECKAGNYCSDGLCQNCDLPDHCGAACTKCPDDARICSLGKCAECIADDQCPSSRSTCEQNACVVPRCCGEKYGTCPDQLNCNPFSNTCTRLVVETFCASDGWCPKGWLCNGKFCLKSPWRCTDDQQCLATEYCDPDQKTCRPLSDRPERQGGCSDQPGAGSECGPIDVPVPNTPSCITRDGEIVHPQVMRLDRPCEGGCRMDRGRGKTRSAPAGLLVLCLFALFARRARTPKRG
jgi:outer membrane exchange protein TraA